MPLQETQSKFTVLEVEPSEEYEQTMRRVANLGFSSGDLKMIHDLSGIEGSEHELRVVTEAKQTGYEIRPGRFSVVFERAKPT